MKELGRFQFCTEVVHKNFYRATQCSYARAVMGVVILSVRLSVCHTRALLQSQTMHCGYFDITLLF